MTSLAFPMFLPWAVAAVSGAAAYMMAVRVEHLQPATVDPFLPHTGGDPSADTLSNSLAQTDVPNAGHPWQVTTVNTLRAVEDLLDSLENHHVAEREVLPVGNRCFAVRWR